MLPMIRGSRLLPIDYHNEYVFTFVKESLVGGGRRMEFPSSTHLWITLLIGKEERDGKMCDRLATIIGSPSSLLLYMPSSLTNKT
jgi:hypothetical protein